MASTVFQDFNQNNPITSTWLNDVNKVTYSPGGIPKNAGQSAAAWVRFAVSGGVVTIQQSSNIASVVKTGVGLFTVTYVTPLTNATNCYEIVQNLPGFVSYGTETTSSIIVGTANTSNVATDPGTCSVVIYGAN